MKNDTQEDIKESYRKLMKMNGLDVCYLNTRTKEKFIFIKDANDVVGNTSNKIVYNRL